MQSQPASTPLSDEQKAQICGILSVGCDRETAAEYVGCSLADIRRHMERDPQFVANVRRAEARIELNHMRCVHDVVENKKEWRAAVWWLERRSPERYGRRTPDAVTTRQLKAFVTLLIDVIKHDVTNAEDLARIVARMQSIAESVEQMLRDADVTQFVPAEATWTADVAATHPTAEPLVQLQLPYEELDGP